MNKTNSAWFVDYSVNFLLIVLGQLKLTHFERNRTRRVYVTITAARVAENPALVADLHYAFREAGLKPWAVPAGSPGQPPMSEAVLAAAKEELAAQDSDLWYVTLCTVQEMAQQNARNIKRTELPAWLTDSCVGPNSHTHFDMVYYGLLEWKSEADTEASADRPTEDHRDRGDQSEPAAGDGQGR